MFTPQKDSVTQANAYKNFTQAEMRAYYTHLLSGGTAEQFFNKAVASDLAKYSPDQERDDHGRFSDGGGAGGGKYPALTSGGNGYSVTEMHYNNAKSDSLVNKVYAAEHSVKEGQQYVKGILEKPTAPIYPKEALVQARNEGNAGEAMRLSYEYQKQYEAYSRAFDKYQKDFKVQNLQSDLAKNTLDGSKAGVTTYINNVINQNWFKEAYGDGGKIGQPDVTVRSVKSYAGQYTSGLTKNEISISSSYTQNEPTILHEIAHYAQTISSTVKYEAHGVKFAQTNLHITENVIGTAAADKLASAYIEKGVPINGR
jgi:putative metallohydrolase (TIGR04338 family)